MAVVINGSGTVTGLAVGGLPDGTVDAGTLADDAVGLAQMASGTDGNLITYDASGNPAAVAVGTSGQVLTSNGAGAAPTMQAGGKVLQVVQGLNTNTLNGGFLLQSTSTSYVSVPLSATITPSATSSKVLVLVSTCFHRGGSSSFTVYAGGSNIGDSTYGLRRLTGAVSQWEGESFTILHSPSTTSATTYQLYARAESGTLYVGGDGGVRNTITVMEIGA